VSNIDNSDFYRVAAEEIENGTYNKGMWLLALTNANGDSELQKVEYLKIRVASLEGNPVDVATSISAASGTQKARQELIDGVEKKAKTGVMIAVAGAAIFTVGGMTNSTPILLLGAVVGAVGVMTWGILS
jgi:hypothetical protein